MSQVPSRPPLGLKADRPKRNPDRLARIAAMPCIVCDNLGLKQRSPTQVHHCIQGRYSQRRANDNETIPLCRGHHQGAPGFISVHGSPAAFRALTGGDYALLEVVDAILARR